MLGCFMYRTRAYSEKMMRCDGILRSKRNLFTTLLKNVTLLGNSVFDNYFRNKQYSFVTFSKSISQKIKLLV